MSEQDKFADLAAAVARDLLGEPNKHLSTATELRFGNQGSMSVDVKKGTFYDHQEGEGGGVLWLIERETGQSVAGGQAVQWLKDNGYDVQDDRPPMPAAGQSGGDGPRVDKNGNWLPQRVPDHGEMTKAYDYRNAEGQLVFQVCRYDWTDPDSPKGRNKTFVQRIPDASNRSGWSYKVRDKITPVPYRLPEVLAAMREKREVFIVEGEKKADMMWERGLAATCNAGGAGKFPDDLVPYFEGAEVIILPDDDPQATRKDGSLKFHDDGRPVHPGRDHAEMVARKLQPKTRAVKIVEIPDLPPKGGVDDWFPAGGTPERLLDLADEAPLFTASDAVASFRSRFGAVLWSDIDAAGPTYDYLVKGVLTENELSFLLGESQSGKSFVAIDIAMAVARGEEWFERKVHQGGVVYQAGESARGVRRRRLPAYRKAHDCADDDLPFVMLEKPVDFYNSDDDVEAFIEECKHWGGFFNAAHKTELKLIIIDTFNKATPGANENDGKDMGSVLARCDRVRRETGAHVMLVHHLNAGGTKARGHTSLFGNVENVITVRRLPPEHVDSDGRKIREWVISKAKDGEDGIGSKFVLRGVELGTDGDGDRITSCIICKPESGAVQPDNPEGVAIPANHAVLFRAIFDAMKTKGVLAPRELGLKQGHYAINRAALWEATRGTVSVTEDESPNKDGESQEDADKRRQAATRKRIERSRDYLYQKGLIGQAETDEPKDRWLWFTGKRVKGFAAPPTTDLGSPRQLPAPDQQEMMTSSFGEIPALEGFE